MGIFNKDIEDKEMHILDHLEELRKRLIVAMIGIIACAFIGFILSPYIFKFMTVGMSQINFFQKNEKPIEDKSSDARDKIAVALEKLLKKGDAVQRKDIDEAIDVFFSSIKSEDFQKDKKKPEMNAEIMATSPMGPIMTKLKIALFAGLLMSLPLVFYELWMFIVPALKPTERKAVLPLVWGTSICFFVGATFAYFIIPLLLNFFNKVSLEMGIEQRWIADTYLWFVAQFMLAGGAIFELPVIVYFLSRLGVVDAKFMRSKRRHAIVIAFIIGAFLGPPDPFSQFFLAIPLIALYELSIWVAVIFSSKNQAPVIQGNNV